MASMAVVKNTASTDLTVVERYLCFVWRHHGRLSAECWVRLSDELHGAALYASYFGLRADAEMLREASALASARGVGEIVGYEPR